MASILIMIAITAIVAEFGLHVIYHWKTGRAGVNEPPFRYLKHLDRLFSKKGGK